MKIKTAVLFSLFSVLTFFACQNDPGTDPNSGNDLFSGEFAIVDLDDAIAVLRDATLDNPMAMDPTQLGGFFGPNHRGPFGQGSRFGRNGHFGPGNRGGGRHLGRIKRELNLSEDQITQIRQIMQDFRVCAELPLAEFRAIIQPLMDAANEQREAIIAAVRNGEMTREEAREQLRALSESVRDAIRNSTGTESARETLCACKLAHLDNVRVVLTEEQQTAWDDWVAGLQGSCFD